MIDPDYGYGLNGFNPGASSETHACNCVGPKNGMPRCPCLMRGVSVKNGRYVQVLDLGPAPVMGETKGEVE